MSHNFYDKSPMWPQFNHGCPEPVPPDAEPYNTPYAVLGYTEAGEPVFTVHTVDGETYDVEAGGNIIVLGDTTYELQASEDGKTLNLVGSDGTTSAVPMYSAVATSESAGLMSAADKAKLDGIEAGAGVTGIFGIKSSTETAYTQSGNYDITKEKLGLGNVENKSAETILGELTAQDIAGALGYTPADAAEVPSASGVTGVKGNAETQYRDGNVNITKENIGLGNVENKNAATILQSLTYQNIVDALGYTPADEEKAVNKVIKVYKEVESVPTAGSMISRPLSTIGSGSTYDETYFVHCMPVTNSTVTSSNFSWDSWIDNYDNLRINIHNGLGSTVDVHVYYMTIKADSVIHD